METKANIQTISAHTDSDDELLKAINTNQVANKIQNIFGLADIDTNGMLSFSELVDLYEGFKTYQNITDNGLLFKSYGKKFKVGLEETDLNYFRSLGAYRGNVDFKDFMIVRNRRQTFIVLCMKL